jgi:calcium-dependent protein kinase
VAPEVLKGKYNEKCDIWSIGIITYMLLSGKTPFFGTTESILSQIKIGKWTFSPEFEKVSSQAKDFIT